LWLITGTTHTTGKKETTFRSLVNFTVNYFFSKVKIVKLFIAEKVSIVLFCLTVEMYH